jgi:hypothetical protein
MRLNENQKTAKEKQTNLKKTSLSRASAAVPLSAGSIASKVSKEDRDEGGKSLKVVAMHRL